MSTCEVLCCRSTQDPKKVYHRFPSDPTRRKKWLQILGKKSTDKISSVVCSSHFRYKDYYPGGKRLLPDAVPVIRLSKGCAKAIKSSKTVSQARHSEPALQNKTSKPATSKKSLPNVTTSKVKRVTKCPQPTSLPKKCSVLPNCKKPVEVVSKQTNMKSVNGNSSINQDKKNKKVDSVDSVKRKNLTKKKPSLKPTSKLHRRSPLGVKHSTVKKDSKIIHKLLSTKNNSTSLKTYSQSKHPASANIEAESSTTKNILNSSSDGQNIYLIEPKVEENADTAQLNVSSITSDSDNINNVKSIPDTDKINKNQKSSTGPISLETDKSVKRKLETNELETSNKRPRTKRKRLLSEDESEMSSNNKTNSNKVQASVKQYKNSSSVKKNVPKRSTTSIIDSKNLSDIEKTILEMQNKIQKLEKKSILDEKKIETFKKALITQRNTDFKILMDEKENELLLRMDLLYLDYDPQRICRLCLLLVDKKENLTSLFWPPKNQALISLIKQATNVQIELEDGMPTGICGECLQDIRRADWLNRRTQRSNMLIRKFISMKKGSAQSSTELPQVTCFGSSESSEDQFEEEVTDVLKIEDVFSLGSSPVAFDNFALKQEPLSDEESKTSVEQNNIYTKADRKPQKCKGCCSTFTNLWTLLAHFNYCRKRFQCSECNKCFWNAELFRKHKQSLYSCVCAENLRHCSECQIHFRWKWQLVFHVLRHVPQVCALCCETLHSEEHLKRHFNEFHVNY